MAKYLEEFIPFISASPGVGKTTTMVNLACAVAEHGKKVLIVDFSGSEQTAANLLNLNDRVIYTVDSLVSKEVVLQKIAIPFKKNRNLAVFPFSPALINLQNKPKELVNLINVFKARFDYIFADMPANFHFPTLSLASKTIVVSDTTNETTSLTTELLAILTKKKYTHRTIINKISESKSLPHIVSQLETNILGAINLNEFDMNEAIISKEPAYMIKSLETGHTFDKIAVNLFNDTTSNQEELETENNDALFKKIFNQSQHFKIS